jgi:1-deoxy-D-xylulose-5-phosphate reductoisomerase
MQRITILGATGSIGVSTLDVLARHPEKYQVYALSAHGRVEELAAQCRQFRPQRAVVGTPEAAAELARLLAGLPVDVSHGEAALCEIAASPDTDTVMAAIVGAAGLAPDPGRRARRQEDPAGEQGSAGDVRPAVHGRRARAQGDPAADRQRAQRDLPVAARRLRARSRTRPGVAKILLTASGGPFLKRAVETLEDVTPEEACKHPNWSMGRKISVDSATMMNKGLEVIEAHWLFGAPADLIEVVIHPQSVIHSMVSYVDGSVLAQLGNPDMRTPIAHALAFPERIASGVAQLDLTTMGGAAIPQARLCALPLPRARLRRLRAGGTAPALLNAANEIAVEAFLERRIGFRDIDRVVRRVMDENPHGAATSIEAVMAQDAHARAAAHRIARPGIGRDTEENTMSFLYTCWPSCWRWGR